MNFLKLYYDILDVWIHSPSERNCLEFVILDKIFYLSLINNDGVKVYDTFRRALFKNDELRDYFIIEPNGPIEQMDEDDWIEYKSKRTLNIYLRKHITSKVIIL